MKTKLFTVYAIDNGFLFRAHAADTTGEWPKDINIYAEDLADVEREVADFMDAFYGDGESEVVKES